MRTDWRNVFLALILLLVGATAAIARQDPEPKSGPVAGDCVRLTVEVVWNTSKPDADPSQETNTTREPAVGTEVMLEVTNGRVIEVMNWPPPNWARVGDGGGDSLVSTPTPASKGMWSLGKRGEGRVRARIEAAVDANLVLRGGDQVIGMPLAAVLERPQRTPPQSRLVVTVERLPGIRSSSIWGNRHGTGSLRLGRSCRCRLGTTSSGRKRAKSVCGRRLCCGRWLAAMSCGATSRARLCRRMWPSRHRESGMFAHRAPRGPTCWRSGRRGSRRRPGMGPRLARLIRRRRPGAVATSAVRRVAFTVVDPDARVGGIGARRLYTRYRGGFGRSVAVAQPPPDGHRAVTAGRAGTVRSGECLPKR